MRREMLLVSAMSASALLAGCGGASQREQVARNEAIVASLPVFPGAVQTREVTAKNPGGSHYTTGFTFRVPKGTRGASVSRFYDTRLTRRGWRFDGVAFTRGHTIVDVVTLFLPPLKKHGEWTYQVLVSPCGAEC